MSKAIGMIEYKTVSAGLTATDIMVKTSEVDIVEAQTVCPGKYISIITGELSAVRASVDAAKNAFEEQHIDSFVLGNPDESIFPAIVGTLSIVLIEIFSFASCVPLSTVRAIYKVSVILFFTVK